MSAVAIKLNPDLKCLQDEGYELEIRDGYAIIRNVPYLDSSRMVQRGTLVSPIRMIGDRVKYDGNHTIYFQGVKPYHKSGSLMEALYHSSCRKTLAGVNVEMMFSNKPANGYRDYYEKFTRYIELLSAEAKAIDPTATAATFKQVVSCDDSIFRYADTNASRAAISDVSDKFREYKIGIIGLGGTGSYLLDQVAKTPVAEIHLYDGDVFCQHNAFRAPGAPAKILFEQQPYKTDYFKEIYGNMHRHVHSHPYNLSEENVEELKSLDFVFIAMDSGESKRVIVDFLRNHGISFIDTGIDISRVEGSLAGMARATLSVKGNTQTADQHISYNEADKDLYQSNVQTADLNALCALSAVILWKKHLRFYKDDVQKENCLYSTGNGEFVWC